MRCVGTMGAVVGAMNALVGTVVGTVGTMCRYDGCGGGCVGECDGWVGRHIYIIIYTYI